MIRSNSNYDIITINCNIMVALFILQIPTIILCTQCKTCSIDHCIGLAIEKYGCLEREEVWYFKWRKSNLQVGGVKTWLI